jgi:type II secretory pathway component PulJ
MDEPVDLEQRRCAVLHRDPRHQGGNRDHDVAANERQPRGGDRGTGGDHRERVERQDRQPAVTHAAEADDRGGEVAVADPRDPVMGVVVREQRLRARRNEHRARGYEREQADCRRPAPQHGREREAEEGQQRDQKPRPRHPPAERHVDAAATGVPQHLHDADRRDQRGLRAEPTPPQQHDAGQAGPDHRREHEQPALVQQQVGADVEIREMQPEEAVVVRGLVDAAGSRVERGALVDEMERRAERPPVVAEQRQESDEPAGGERHQPPEVGDARRCVEPEQHRRHCERRVRRDGEPGRRSGRRDPPRAGVPSEQQREGQEREQRCGHVREQHRRERQHQRPESERHRGGGSQSRLDPLHRPAQEDEQQDRRQHHRPQAHLPQRAERHADHRGGIRLARVRVGRDGTGRAKQQVPRRSPEVERRLLRGVVVPVPLDEVACLAGVAVDRRAPVRVRADGGVMRGLPAARRLHRQCVHDRDRPDRHRREEGRAAHRRTISRAAAPSPRARLTRGTWKGMLSAASFRT